MLVAADEAVAKYLVKNFWTPANTVRTDNDIDGSELFELFVFYTAT